MDSLLVSDPTNPLSLGDQTSRIPEKSDTINASDAQKRVSIVDSTEPMFFDSVDSMGTETERMVSKAGDVVVEHNKEGSLPEKTGSMQPDESGRQDETALVKGNQEEKPGPEITDNMQPDESGRQDETALVKGNQEEKPGPEITDNMQPDESGRQNETALVKNNPEEKSRLETTDSRLEYKDDGRKLREQPRLDYSNAEARSQTKRVKGKSNQQNTNVSSEANEEFHKPVLRIDQNDQSHGSAERTLQKSFAEPMEIEQYDTFGMEHQKEQSLVEKTNSRQTNASDAQRQSRKRKRVVELSSREFCAKAKKQKESIHETVNVKEPPVQLKQTHLDAQSTVQDELDSASPAELARMERTEHEEQNKALMWVSIPNDENLTKLKKLISGGFSVAGTDTHSYLSMVAGAKSDKYFNLILDHVQHPENKKTDRALWKICASEHLDEDTKVERCRQLIKKGWTFKDKPLDKKLSLISNLLLGNVDFSFVFRHQLEKIDVNDSIHGEPGQFFKMLFEGKNKDMIRFFMDHDDYKSEFKAGAYKSYNYMSHACKLGLLDIADELLKKDPIFAKTRSREYGFPIQALAYSDSVESVEAYKKLIQALQKQGANINENSRLRGKKSITPIEIAVSNGNLVYIKALRECGANCSVITPDKVCLVTKEHSSFRKKDDVNTVMEIRALLGESHEVVDMRTEGDTLDLDKSHKVVDTIDKCTIS